MSIILARYFHISHVLKMISMKKITAVLVSLILTTAFICNTAKAQPPRHKFYYYPSHNVYFDPTARLYYYDNHGVWSGVTVLPGGFSVTVGSPRVMVYHNGPEVWFDNSRHRSKYRHYGYEKRNPSRRRFSRRWPPTFSASCAPWPSGRFHPRRKIPSPSCPSPPPSAHLRRDRRRRAR